MFRRYATVTVGKSAVTCTVEPCRWECGPWFVLLCGRVMIGLGRIAGRAPCMGSLAFIYARLRRDTNL